MLLGSIPIRRILTPSSVHWGTESSSTATTKSGSQMQAMKPFGRPHWCCGRTCSWNNMLKWYHFATLYYECIFWTNYWKNIYFLNNSRVWWHAAAQCFIRWHGNYRLVPLRSLVGADSSPGNPSSPSSLLYRANPTFEAWLRFEGTPPQLKIQCTNARIEQPSD